MPTYDYKCAACSHTFEHFQSMKDKSLRKCPKCGTQSLERLIGTGAAVIFKGGGFYQTDYRSEAYKKSAEADSKPATTDVKSDAKPADAPTPASAESKSGGKAEPKPATKAEPNQESNPSPTEVKKPAHKPKPAKP